MPPGPAQPPFRLQSSPESTRKHLLHTRGISRARSFDLEVTPWAPTRLTSCIFHSGHAGAYEPLRSTLCAARTPLPDLLVPESAQPPVCRSGISWARSFDLEVTPWAPTRLTSSISHTCPKESCAASTLTQAAQVRPGAISPPRTCAGHADLLLDRHRSTPN